MDTPMPAIELAYHGRIDMLQAIFGGGKEPEPSERSLPATPDNVRNFFKIMGRGKRKNGRDRRRMPMRASEAKP